LAGSMLRLNTKLSELMSPTYANRPEGSMARDMGPVPTGTEPIDARVPEIGSIWYMETSNSWFATYANFPVGSIVTSVGNAPAATVPSDVSSPLPGSMLNIETSLEPWFAV